MSPIRGLASMLGNAIVSDITTSIHTTMDTHSLPILVRIGKAGITESVLKEIRMQVRKNTVIKVKFLPGNAAGKDKKAFARELAEKTGTRFVSQVGFVVVLSRV